MYFFLINNLLFYQNEKYVINVYFINNYMKILLNYIIF